MNVYESKFAEVRRILETHNQRIEEPKDRVNIDQFFARISAIGGTCEEGLRDLCGQKIQAQWPMSPMLASAIVAVFTRRDLELIQE